MHSERYCRYAVGWSDLVVAWKIGGEPVAGFVREQRTHLAAHKTHVSDPAQGRIHVIRLHGARELTEILLPPHNSTAQPGKSQTMSS